MFETWRPNTTILKHNVEQYDCDQDRLYIFIGKTQATSKIKERGL